MSDRIKWERRLSHLTEAELRDDLEHYRTRVANSKTSGALRDSARVAVEVIESMLARSAK